LQLNGQFDAAVVTFIRQAGRASAPFRRLTENISRLLWMLGKRDTFAADLDAAVARFPRIAGVCTF